MKSKKPSGKIKRMLYKYCGDWVNYYESRNYCLCQRFGNVYCRPITGRLTRGVLSPRLSENDKIINCKSENSVPMVGPRVIVASGDRTPTASGDQKYDIPDWLQPFTEGLGETIPNTPPQIPTRPSNKPEGNHNFVYTHTSKHPNCDIYRRTKKSRELHAERTLKIEHKIR